MVLFMAACRAWVVTGVRKSIEPVMLAMLLPWYCSIFQIDCWGFVRGYAICKTTPAGVLVFGGGDYSRRSWVWFMVIKTGRKIDVNGIFMGIFGRAV